MRRNTSQEFLAKLVDGTVELPGTAQTQPKKFTYKELGIGFPIIAFHESSSAKYFSILDPSKVVETGPTLGADTFRLGTTPATPKINPYINVLGYECSVQFCWQPMRASEREEKRREESEQAAKPVADTDQ